MNDAQLIVEHVLLKQELDQNVCLLWYLSEMSGWTKLYWVQEVPVVQVRLLIDRLSFIQSQQASAAHRYLLSGHQNVESASLEVDQQWPLITETVSAVVVPGWWWTQGQTRKSSDDLTLNVSIHFIDTYWTSKSDDNNKVTKVIWSTEAHKHINI